MTFDRDVQHDRPSHAPHGPRGPGGPVRAGVCVCGGGYREKRVVLVVHLTIIVGHIQSYVQRDASRRQRGRDRPQWSPHPTN